MAWLRDIWNWLTDPKPAQNSAENQQPQEGFSRNAGWADVFHLIGLLEKHRAEYVLIGGYALSFNGLDRQTGDVDILVSTTPENNRRWISALSELPGGFAQELFETADDPFAVAAADGPSGPGVIRVNDVFTVDVLLKACGLTLDDLKAHVRRTITKSGPINVLDLEGLRLTKQSERAKDKVDLQNIEAALMVIRGRLAERIAGMSRRDFVAEPQPVGDRIEFKVDPPEQDQVALMVEEIVGRASARNIVLEAGFVDRLRLYGDVESLRTMLRDADAIDDFESYANEQGIADAPHL